MEKIVESYCSVEPLYKSSERHYKSSEKIEVKYSENTKRYNVTSHWYSLERMSNDIQKYDADFPNYLSLLKRINDEDTLKIRNKVWLKFKTMKGLYEILIETKTFQKRLELEIKYSL
jgi:hypothetical protein